MRWCAIFCQHAMRLVCYILPIYQLPSIWATCSCCLRHNWMSTENFFWNIRDASASIKSWCSRSQEIQQIMCSHFLQELVLKCIIHFMLLILRSAMQLKNPAKFHSKSNIIKNLCPSLFQHDEDIFIAGDYFAGVCLAYHVDDCTGLYSASFCSRLLGMISQRFLLTKARMNHAL